MLLLSERFLHEDVYRTGWEPLGAIVAGVVIGVIGVTAGIRARPQPDPERVTT